MDSRKDYTIPPPQSHPPPSTGLLAPANQMSLHDAAVHYARLGLKVFPIQPMSKLPLPGWSWARMNSSDPETVSGWWRVYPNANIGLACGAVSNVIGLDVDMKNGQDGVGSYRAIVQEPYTGPAQRTPSGGGHMLFAYRPGFINFTHRGELGGLDMRTDNGYILLAPSHTSDGPYVWTQDGKIMAMPEKLQLACTDWSTATNTMTVDAPEVPEQLTDWRTLGLSQSYARYLEDGDTSPWEHDESRAVFAVAGALMVRLNDPGEVFGIMSDNPHVWACAERHRSRGNPAEWLWKYGIGKMVTAAARQAPEDVFGTNQAPVGPQLGPAPENPPPHPWERLKAGDLCYIPAPMLDLLVQDLLPARTVTSLVGPPGQGKTQFAIQLGVALATGAPAFLCPRFHVVEPCATLIIDCEDPRDEFHRRIQVTLAGGQYTDEQRASVSEWLGWFYPEGKDIRMVDSLGNATPVVDQVISLINTAPVPIRQLIIGPTINLLSGDENDNAHMQALINTWHRIHAETGAGVMGLHHTTKTATMAGARTQTSARGAGAFAGSVRAMIYLQNMTKQEGAACGIEDGTHTQWCGLSLVKANGLRVFEDPVWLKRADNSAYMQWQQEQPKMQAQPTSTIEAELFRVATTARELLSTVEVPITSRVFAEAHGGMLKPFGMGWQKLRDMLNICCDRGLLEHTTAPHPNGGLSYTLLPQGPLPGMEGDDDVDLF